MKSTENDKRSMNAEQKQFQSSLISDSMST